MDTESGDIGPRFTPRDYLRALWLPGFLELGFFLFLLSCIFVEPHMSVWHAMPVAWLSFLWLYLVTPKAPAPSGSDRQAESGATRLLPNSRWLGYAVLGAACCCAAAVGLGFHSGLTEVWYVLGAAGSLLGWLGCTSRFLMWSGLTPSNRLYDRWFGYCPFNAVTLVGLLVVIAIVPVTVLKGQGEVIRSVRFYLPFVLLGVCLVAFYRQAIELALEPFFWLLYAIRGAGPGAYRLPPAGPVIVIANHCSWLDPVFVSKVLPRPITPMMTSKFYDVWFLRPLLKYVFKVIVVPDVKVRREAPELKLAVAALDRGEVLVIFPEGALRRKDDVTLKRFGQGVWMILKERPNTPVVSCWIEGSWGSYFSHFNGPPTKNKRMDFRRPVGVGMNGPETVPPGILENGMLTRIHLMNRVLAARDHLGLPSLPPVALPPAGEPEVPDAAN